MSKKTLRNLIFLILILGIAIYFVFIDSAGFYQKYKVEKELKKKQAEMEYLQKENERLSNENKDLETNIRSWESKARDLGMQKEGEEIYKFKSNNDKK